jgi:hypothetical protein
MLADPTIDRVRRCSVAPMRCGEGLLTTIADIVEREKLPEQALATTGVNIPPLVR